MEVALLQVLYKTLRRVGEDIGYECMLCVCVCCVYVCVCVCVCVGVRFHLPIQV